MAGGGYWTCETGGGWVLGMWDSASMVGGGYRAHEALKVCWRVGTRCVGLSKYSAWRVGTRHVLLF